MPARIVVPNCDACGNCADACPADAIEMQNEKAFVKPENCMDCGICLDECPNDAIEMIDD